MLNRQEVFDKVANHLINQSAKSINVSEYALSGNGCAYRGNNGMKCAVGCLIPDERYSPKMEGKSPSGANDVCREVFNQELFPEILHDESPTAPGTDWDFLRGLQTIHDDSSVAMWALKLKEFAERWDLKWTFNY